MKFYNRKKELSFLNEIKSRKNENIFVVIYGRRRIGKTTLVRKAFENEENVFYYFVEVLNQNNLLEKISLSFSKAVFKDWYDLFMELFEKFEYVIFDEFQNFYKVSPSILYSLQKAWDEIKFRNYNTKLIVLGSYVGLMKKIFYDSKMPLFGRKDYLMNLQEFSLNESIKMLIEFGYSSEEAFEIYSIVGGIPNYLLFFKEKKSLDNLIFELFLKDYAPLKNEGENILALEFGSEHRSYFSILEALAGAPKSISEISDISKVEKTSLPRFLKELKEEYGIVKGEEPLLSQKKRMKKYKINDFFFDFYFTFIRKNLSTIEFTPEKAFEIVWKALPQYFGLKFEQICTKFLMEKSEFLGFIPERIGKTWGKIPGEKNKSFDIDLVAYDMENIVFGECKWTNKKVGIEEYNKLVVRSSYVKSGNRKKRYIIFSKSGFKKELFKIKDLLLLTPENMVKQ
ncbi:AAA family ATPase [Thermosipho ferrireducens]|uniref:AAA family ATPase n=1 Tax=Thermosipho ferrireducens TaxID=2571116 RepID=A0ABX7S922_9BACT|nr:ATP-binding protein [Thermosipho ferrireducens]QTA38453.1 AAA family ATPase [Thermosipho ferrireducens]